MFNLSNIFHKNHGISDEELAHILHSSPQALEEFEKIYSENVLSDAPQDFYEVNSRQMAQHMAEKDIGAPAQVSDLEERIIDELLAQTSVWKYVKKNTSVPYCISRREPDRDSADSLVPVSKEEIYALPKDRSPQCTGRYCHKDIDKPAYPMLVYQYLQSKDPKLDRKTRQTNYHMFRQGLDILDIDPVTYEMIGMNKTSMGYWLPKIAGPVSDHGYFKIPDTTIMKVPATVLQLTRQDYMSLTRSTLNIVDGLCYKAFDLKDDGDYFIKTGVYSSKYDFRNCRVNSPKEIKELGEYLLFIHHQTVMMAGCLNTDGKGKPVSMYGAATTNEWCVREYIKDKENNPCIYKGLPLHTEYRVFVDFDKDTVLSCVPYWDPDTMKKRFEKGSDTSMHDKHDFVIYKAHEETLMTRFRDNKETIMHQLEKVLPDIDMEGQWSIDIMQNGNEFWLIDMAPASVSAFKESIPPMLVTPMEENWLPDLGRT